METDYQNWRNDSELLAMDHIAGSSTLVEIRRGEKEWRFHKGKYTEYGIVREAKFLICSCTPAGESYCQQIVTLSRRVNSPYVLAPVVVSKSFDGRSIFMGYQFDKWDVRDHILSFCVPNGIMDPRWRSQGRHLLTTIKDMHDAGVYHGGLADVQNYVYRAKMIRIINPANDVKDGKTPAQIEQLKEKDIHDFRHFLTIVLQGGLPSIDLNLFYNLFTTPDVDNKIQCLINHPVLKDEDKRLMYFGNWYNCCRHQRVVHYKVVNKLNNKLRVALNAFTGWAANLSMIPIYLNRYNKPTSNDPTKSVAPYQGHDVLDLIRFVRNVAKHFVIEGLRTSVQIERDIQRMFPGFISRLHNVVATMSLVEYGVVREPEI